MERLRKYLEAFRQKVRGFIKYNWHNEPEGDKFRSLDILYVLGAVRCEPTTKWRRISWYAYRVVSVGSFLIYVLNAVDEMPRKFNLTKAIWHGTVVLTTGLCFVKDFILNQHFESIQSVRNFIKTKPFASGDSVIQINNDSACRKKCFQRLQLAVMVFLSVVLIDLTICNMSIAGIDELLGTPQILQYLGPILAAGIHFLFLFTTAPLWLSKYCAGTGTICSLLYGFNTDYEIYARGFDNILENVYSDVEEEFPPTEGGAPDWKRFQRDQLFWKHLKQRINDQVKLHVRFAENLQLLKPVVKYLFGVIYYNAMIIFSPFIYIIFTNGLSVTSFLLISGIAPALLECYICCRFIDSFKDTNMKLELKIMDLITTIPYSQFHRKKFAEMRTTLCIMKTFVRNHEPFSCLGVFPISVEAFTELLHSGYTVFTFLRDMGKKDLKVHRRMRKNRKH